MTAHVHQNRVVPNELACFSEALQAFVNQLSENTQVTVAYSGGLDSTVLLHLLSLSPCLKKRLTAHYIDHGLQAESSDWRTHCQEVCDLLGISFQSTQVLITSVKREGIEAVARRLRYQALTCGCCLKKNVLVTGHHQRDQAETVLLNLARGSGVSGLSGMPDSKVLCTEKGALVHRRPLLNIPYHKLVAYANHFQLRWVEDPSNASTQYRRNVIRQEVLPVLKHYWSDVEATIARTATNMSEAQILLDRMASVAVNKMQNTAFYFDFFQLNTLDWLEQKNSLRYWFFKQFKLVLSSKHYDWIKTVLDQNAESRQGAFSYKMRKGQLRFYRQRLYYQVNAPVPFLFKGVLYKSEKNPPPLLQLNLSEKGLVLTPVLPLNLPANLLEQKGGIWVLDSHFIDCLPKLVVRSLSEKDKVNRKKLKTFFQKKAIPTWERSVWPVIECDGVVVSVLGCEEGVIKSVNLLADAQEGGEKIIPPLLKILLTTQERHNMIREHKSPDPQIEMRL